MYMYLDRVGDLAGIVQYGELGVLLLELGGAVVGVVLVLTLKLLEQCVVIGSRETTGYEEKMYACIAIISTKFVTQWSSLARNKKNTSMLYVYTTKCVLCYMYMYDCQMYTCNYMYVYMQLCHNIIN